MVEVGGLGRFDADCNIYMGLRIMIYVVCIYDMV